MGAALPEGAISHASPPAMAANAGLHCTLISTPVDTQPRTKNWLHNQLYAVSVQRVSQKCINTGHSGFNSDINASRSQPPRRRVTALTCVV